MLKIKDTNDKRINKIVGDLLLELFDDKTPKQSVEPKEKVSTLL